MLNYTQNCVKHLLRTQHLQINYKENKLSKLCICIPIFKNITE